MMGGAKAAYDSIMAFSQTDFTEDLKKPAGVTPVLKARPSQVARPRRGPPSAKLRGPR
jgi:non-heme chloroperoxidase